MTSWKGDTKTELVKRGKTYSYGTFSLLLQVHMHSRSFLFLCKSKLIWVGYAMPVLLECCKYGKNFFPIPILFLKPKCRFLSW